VPKRPLKSHNEKAIKAQLNEMRIARARNWIREAIWIAQISDFDPVGWHASGLDEVEILVRALDTGGSHPWPERWSRLKAANRSAPDENGLHLRQLVCLFCSALQRTGRNKREAREDVAERLRGLPQAPSADTIKNWQQRERQLDKTRAEKIMASAFARGPEQVTTFFVSVIAWHLDPRQIINADL
jgi:hypothetical protein